MVAVSDVHILGTVSSSFSSILTPEAQLFLRTLHRSFNERRKTLLEERKRRQLELDLGLLPDFLPETQMIRDDLTWKGPSPSKGLVDRRVEITGPVDRKMVINALNSGATQFMADFEDSTCPTWSNVMNGQVNLRDAVKRTISFTAPNGTNYSLKGKNLPTLLVRPRGWHLDECHFMVDGKPISASLFDFGLYFFHNAQSCIENGFGPYFYLPKLESHTEARLWNDVFNMSQDILKIPRGTIRATVLIETILAAFEMEEIIYELRDHSSGLNCGRWDYIFSYIKKFHKHSKCILAERSKVTMTVPFMKAYVELLIKTCHKRGVHAMGGMAAQIPIKNDSMANERAMNKVKEDKMREVLAGHDGTWVAHPALIPIAKEIFDSVMPQPNQIHISQEGFRVDAHDLLESGVDLVISKEGLVENVKVALLYMHSWLNGDGCIPINNLMEDAATAEIARAQLWQWSRHNCSTTDTCEPITIQLVKTIIMTEAKKLANEQGGHLKSMSLASERLCSLIEAEEFIEFLTSYCYPDIIQMTVPSKY